MTEKEIVLTDRYSEDMKYKAIIREDDVSFMLETRHRTFGPINMDRSFFLEVAREVAEDMGDDDE